ncbi:Fe-S cluster assembly protein SufD [Phenylobacterium sp. 20VBR1]|uniref:Fe-S cluster assembly protein SufD n=1 Tax=Phenylobacterium glaciei TaxID=2803784 RepID=A0A941D059_9CAUL|nr:Fe-S cluster assembly protein SufD [Phenylobacterium glaciei]MBR7619806.1 Fe-S cluster assembly protein SufD [Phenylobacterium glaciei]QQZ48792.1 Fe-S cluster assembly protein SufD [Phenylobacterium glaciei]
MSLSTALKSGDVSLLPGKRDEDWKWTDLRGLLRVLPAAAPALDLVGLAEGPFDALADERHVVAGGQPDVVIDVPADGSLAVSLRVLSRDGGALTGKVTIRVGANAKLRLLESYEGDASAYVTDTALTIRLEAGAAIERIVLAADGAEGVTVSQAQVILSPGAEYGQTVITNGARRQRIETQVTHPGAHAKLRLDGLYLLEDKRHADLTTVVLHQGVDGATDQFTRGVVRDQSRGIFQGRIVVEEGADRTDARMRHNALILSDKAEIDAKPELLIFADDVQCAHGNTIGALDEEALFYMRQRGLPETEARALLIEAFVGAVADRIGFEPVRDIARSWAAERLRA